MRKMTFRTAAAVMLSVPALASAADFAPPPKGSPCEEFSLQLLGSLGNKGVRVKVNPFTERDDTLHFALHEDAQKLLKNGPIEIGRLDAIDASNFNDVGNWIPQVGLKAILTEMAGYGDEYGAWAVAVPNEAFYMVALLFQIGPDEQNLCLMVNKDPLLLDRAAIPAAYLAN